MSCDHRKGFCGSSKTVSADAEMTTSPPTPTCVLPGCPNSVGEQGRPCAECLAQCGAFLQIGDGPAMTAEEQAARDTEIRRRYALQQECADRNAV